MKVLVMITKSNWGGAQRYVHDLAINLPKNDYEVEVMTAGNGTLVEKLREAGIKVSGDLPMQRDVSLFGDIKVFFKLISILRQKRPDILHVNSSKMGGLGSFAGRLLRIPRIIFTAHGWAFNENRTFFSKMIIGFLHWLTVLFSHHTIAVSETLENQMKNWPFILKKITVVHNGIATQVAFSKINARYELAKIKQGFENITKKYPAKDLVIIGSVGELHQIKGYKYALRGIYDLVKSYEKINPKKKVVYVIFGEGEDRDNLVKEIQRLEMSEYALLFGNIPSAFQYFKVFDIFLIPSLSEGLPYVLLEAGISGLPIVATAVGGIPEVIDDMESGILIQPKKSKEIHHALELFLTHKKIQKEYGLSIRQKIVDQFSIDKMISETIKIYEKSSRN